MGSPGGRPCLAFVLGDMTMNMFAVQEFFHLRNLALRVKADKIDEFQNVRTTCIIFSKVCDGVRFLDSTYLESAVQ